MGHPTIYPTGATLYNSKKSWNGYTIFQAMGIGAVLIDMNGNEVQHWSGLDGFPNKLLPGGQVIGSTGERNPKYGFQDMTDLVQVDWEGNIVWSFNKTEFIEDPGEEGKWMARQHHDYQREGNPVGYYTPVLEPLTDSGNTLILTHENVVNNEISDKVLIDDKIIEVNWNGEIIWQWKASEHFHELGFKDTAKKVIFNDPNMRPVWKDGAGDWLHINSVSKIGPNKWFDEGDERFNPDNIIWDSREANIIAIIDKITGKIVWQLGPDYDDEKSKNIGWIIGQHHAHIIPRGLPGEGNLLVFDNGGWSGYGDANPNSPDGRQNARRDYSRVLEINPITLEIVWQYTPEEADLIHPLDSSRFYSPFVSGAQRLLNGNTLITEGSDGRIFEVTSEHEIVWEYINPYHGVGKVNMNMVYRAYRVPYEWVPQLDKPEEIDIERLDIKKFRVPNSGALGPKRQVEVTIGKKYDNDNNFCVLAKK